MFVETPATGQAREVTEIGVFAAFAARQVANLRKDASMLSMCAAFSDLEHLDPGEDAPQTVGETRLVPPTPSQGRKGFVGTVKTKDGVPFINLKPQGFGVMARGVSFYAPTATTALLLHLLARHSEEGRFVLV